MAITIALEVLEHSFEHLQRCGQGRRECVLAWIAPLENPDHINEVIHPKHTATAGSYDIDPVWIGELWLDLAKRHRTVRAQVHTHPGSAYHSSRDDTLALVHTPGYLSLVIPTFARGAVGLNGSFLAVRAADGSWHQLDPHNNITITP